MKKGLVFSLEALVAISILLSLITFLFIFNIENVSPYKRFERVQLYTKDCLEVMSQITVKDLLDQIPSDKIPTLVSQIGNPKIYNDTSIMETIGILWSEGETDTAKSISSEVLSLMIPKTLAYKLKIGGDEVVSSRITTSTEVSGSRKITSGFQPGSPTKGFWAWANLTKIQSKVFSSYFYFGGYLGQGNLTFFINDIPSRAEINSVYMEASVDSNFTLTINDEYCGLFTKSASGDFPVDTWNIECSDKNIKTDIIKPGESNKFEINFTDPNITKKGIGGGYIKVTYNTDEFSTGVSNTMRYNLPGIDGIINLYDSFYVPGNITSMSMKLNISSYEKVFVTIGNKTVYYDNISAFIDNATFSSLLDYDFLSRRTVPFRIGHYGIDPIGPTYAHIVLTTSIVRGMRNRDVPNGTETITRIKAAMELGNLFVDIALENPGNLVGLRTYHSSAPTGEKYMEQLTPNILKLKSEINEYETIVHRGIGERCLCCAIAGATDILIAGAGGPSIKNYTVLMSDGDAASAGGGRCHSSSDDPRIAAIDEACYAYQNYGIRVFTIGFGQEANNTLLQQIAACGGGEWASSTDYEGLKKIYEEFAKKMTQRTIVYDFQPVSATGVNSTLFPDSYLEFKYRPEVPRHKKYDITLRLETDPFDSGSGCNGSFYIPEQFKVDDIRVVSYSSNLWTETLSVRRNSNSWTVYNLTNFGTQYIDLGDPFNIQFSPEYIKSGDTNNITLVLAKNTTEKSSKCSSNNKAIYTVRFNVAPTFSGVLPRSSDTRLNVSFDRNFDCEPEGWVVVNIGTPRDNTPVITVDNLDTANNAVHNATAQLLNKLKVSNAVCSGPAGSETNPINIELTDELEIHVGYISDIPSLWGPTTFELIISS